MEAALADGADARRTPTSARTRAPRGSSTPARPAPAATSTRPSPRPGPTAWSSSGAFRQQRLIPAFMEPRSVVVDPTGEQITMWSATQIPHILASCSRSPTGIPEHKIRVIAPDVGGGFGGKLQVTPEEMLTVLVARRLGKPVQVHRDPLGVAAWRRHHGRDQIQDITLAARQATAPSPASRSTCSPTWAPTSAWSTPGVPILGAFMFNAIYKFPAYRFACTQRLHQQDLDRRLPRRRPARGDVRHRADHGRARRRARRRPAGAARAELDQARGVPVHHGVPG